MLSLVSRASRQPKFFCTRERHSVFRRMSTAFSPKTLKWDYTASEVGELCERIELEYSASIKKVLEQEPSTLNFQNTFGDLAVLDGRSAAQALPCILLSLVSQDKEVRQASQTAKTKLSQMWNNTYLNDQIFKFLEESRKRISESELEPEQKRLVSKTMELFSKNGMFLEPEQKKALMEMRNEIFTLADQFCTNINEDTSTIEVSESDLEGVSPSFVKSLPRNGDKLVLGCKSPQYVAVMEGAKKEEMRKQMMMLNYSKCVEANSNLLKKTLELRQKSAKLLGFSSHTEFMLSQKMVKTPEKAFEFLEMLSKELKEIFEKEMSILTATKQETCGNGKVEAWDTMFLTREAKKKLFSIDQEHTREYFPLDPVITEIFEIYSELLGVTITKMEGVPTWHSSVLVYQVTDKNSSENIIGYFYLDLFSRPGKYAHQCVYPMIPSFVEVDGQVKPCCAILGNLTSPTADQPSLLYHKEVTTFFHEFGHVMHCVLTKSKFSLFSWNWPIVPWYGGVEQDFLEVPSMMFELWMDKKVVLDRISGHYKDRSKKLDSETIKQLARSQHFMESIGTSKVIAMSLYDLIIHSQDGPYNYKDAKDLDLVSLFDHMLMQYAGFSFPQNTFMVASWYHPCMGYDAGYYGYLWSEAYSHDIFSLFPRKEKSLVDQEKKKEMGGKVREHILEPGATRDGMEMLVDCLGREPSLDSYLKFLKEGSL
eukprot:TRINITY_DN9683_c0_g2_i2.p1 TRINITY_DN9683_c0_g2~~TRINITY_DN9683_c0_g2_i2.p1  ORF type:complete len:709 (+),score=148.03 TRINITY_DN9683_c0_g2_i2:88-2214(+)